MNRSSSSKTRGAKTTTVPSAGGFKMSSTTTAPSTSPSTKDTSSTSSLPMNSFMEALKAASSVAAATLANILPDLHVNLFCLCDNSGDLVFVGAKGRVCHINIYASKPLLCDLTPSSASSTDAGIFSSATRLAFNRDGTKVLVETQSSSIHHRGLYVFNLPLDGHHRLAPRPHHVQIHFLDGSSRVVSVPSTATETSVQHTMQSLPASERAKVKTISPDVYEIDCRQLLLLPTVTPVAAAWHPLSDSHVVVLTSTDEVLVFATNDSTFSPEQTHVLDFPSTDSTGAAIAFGPPTGWEVFTCYIVRGNGDVFALSPLVPIECSVSTSLLHFLHQKTEGLLTQSNLDMDTRIQLKAQKHWLSHVWPHLPPAVAAATGDDDDDDDDVTTRRRQLTLPTVATSAASAQILPDRWPAQLQGPFPYESKWTSAAKDDKAVSLVCVAYGATDNNIGQAPVLAVGWASGHVTIVVLEREVRPVWKTARKQPPTRAALSLFTVECLNLGATLHNGKLDLATHAFQPHVLYAYHSTSVHVLHLHWMKQKTGLHPPFTSTVHRVFAISPAAPAHVVGCHTLFTVERGHVLVAMLSNGKWELVNLSAQTAPALTTSSTTPTQDTSGNPITPLTAIVDALQTKHVTSKLRVSGATPLPETSVETFQFVQNQMPHLLDQVEYVEALHAKTKARQALHQDWSAEQRTQATTLAASVAAFEASTKTLETRVDAMQAKQRALNARAAAILQALKENQAVVTKAEKKYKADLLAMQQQTRRLVPKVTQLNLQAQAMLRKPTTTTTTKLSDEKTRICHDVLTAETQLIADTTALLHELTDNLTHLRL
ncbi:Aste57867_24548 [Aphanomyces stellatus]|uniref:Aste57867_24548 protein n=1 Tax=Aphanomyces stellatus TaxID=120398 RepID=A0A485LQM6_9STRA|nr:hypothetical protein As57867_024471 [Aphanomyces stellatus]VFU01187.1 Aste57867_24548 [Aphanomyces stellatus]